MPIKHFSSTAYQGLCLMMVIFYLYATNERYFMINYTHLPLFLGGTPNHKARGRVVFIAYGVAALIYVAVCAHLYSALMREHPIHKKATIGALGVAMVLHGMLLYPQIITLYGLNFNIFNALSLTGLFFLAFFVLFSLYRPILSLGVLATPTALVSLSIGYFGQAAYEPIHNPSLGLSLHILLSFAAYCALLMSAVQAIILKLQIRELKHKTIHRFWVNKLPALQSMESLLFDMILTAFVLLSLALGLGFVTTYDIFAQHVAHKTVFSLLSWFVLGWIIFAHYHYGWRGTRVANLTLYSFGLLAVGFIGSKAVLELILGR